MTLADACRATQKPFVFCVSVKKNDEECWKRIVFPCGHREKIPLLASPEGMRCGQCREVRNAAR